MPEEDKIQLKQTRDHITKQEEWLEAFLDDKSTFLQKRGSLKFRKFNRKTPVLEFLFNKVAGLKACNFIKNRLKHRCFPMKFANFLRTPFFREHFRWLLLKIMNSNNYLRVLPIFTTRQFHQFFYKNSLTILPSASTVMEHFYLLKIATILETRTAYFKQKSHFLINQRRT